MIKFISDEEFEEANKLLECFNFEITASGDNPFLKCIVSKEKNLNGILVFNLIYDRIELNYIVVKSCFKRQGIAQEMLEYLFKFSKMNNIRNITLEVNKNNIPAINLYIKNGFKQVAVRKNYYGLDDAILMIRKFDNNE